MVFSCLSFFPTRPYRPYPTFFPTRPPPCCPFAFAMTKHSSRWPLEKKTAASRLYMIWIMFTKRLYTSDGAMRTKNSAVKWLSKHVLSINDWIDTLYTSRWTLDWHLCQFLVNTKLVLNQHFDQNSIDTQLSVGQLNWQSVNPLIYINRLSMACLWN